MANFKFDNSDERFRNCDFVQIFWESGGYSIFTNVEKVYQLDDGVICLDRRVWFPPDELRAVTTYLENHIKKIVPFENYSYHAAKEHDN